MKLHLKRRAAVAFITGAALLAVAATSSVVAWRFTHSDGGHANSAEQFAALLRKGINIDYTPLESPSDALSKADLVIVGRVEEVQDGLAFMDSGRLLTRYVTLVIGVDQVLDGPPATLTDGKAYVEVPASPAVTVGSLAAAKPAVKVVAVLDDLSGYTPLPTAVVQRPATIPPDVRFYAAYTDGIWFETGSGGMVGIYAEREDLPAAWGTITSVDDFVAKLASAKQ